jgi:tetratricopeptide (TPR) repeat protein
MLRFGLELEPGYWGPYMGLGNFLFRHGRYEEAAEQYLKVTDLTPDNPDGFNNLGAALFDAMDWEGAEMAWQVSLELDPTPMAYRNMGTVLYYQGRYEEAAAMHEKAIELAPEDHWLWGKLAATYLEMEGQEEDSRAAYQKAIALALERLQIEPNDSPTMAYLAAYFANIGDHENAREFAATAKQLEPENPEIWYFSALVNIHSQQNSRAVEDLAKAVELGYSTRLLAADPQLSGLSALEQFQRLIH